MGLGLSVSANADIQSQKNTIMQQVENQCQAVCNQVNSGTIIFLDGSNTGDINFNQTCTVDATCTIDTTLEIITFETQKSIQNGESSPSWFPGIQFNATVNTTKEDIRNDYSQVISTVCGADVEQELNDTVVYAVNSTTGNINFTQDANSVAACVVNNSAKASLTLTQDSQQTATAGGTSFGVIIAVVIIIIVIIVVLAVVFRKKGNDTQSSTIAGNMNPASKAAITRKVLLMRT